jgi:hypothetical protein
MRTGQGLSTHLGATEPRYASALPLSKRLSVRYA